MWDHELAELERRKELAARMGGPERVARQHATGRLTVRERFDALADSWTEVGALTGRAVYDEAGELKDFTPSNTIVGRAVVAGRKAVLVGDDFTVRGGAADAAIHEKQVLAERMAGEMRQPLVRLVDGTGGGGSVKQLEEFGRTYVPHNPGWDQVVANLGRVPVVALALGPVAGLGAARLVTSHVSIMVRELSQVFVAGPAVVEAGMGESVGKEELGGWRPVSAAGTVDLVASSEQKAFELTRSVLSYLPQNAWTRPPVRAGRQALDQSVLRDIVPRDRRRPYDMRVIMRTVFDDVLELGGRFAPSTITALARLDGHPVAVLAGDPNIYGGGMTADGADKTARFVDLAQTFSLPVVHLVDQPGFVIGSAAERAGTIRHGARALAAVYQSTVPWASVLVRRVFGVAGAAHRPHSRYGLRIAWPSGDWGSLPVEGGLEVAFKRMLAEAGEEAAALKAEIAARLEAVRSPFRTAEAFLVEDIVDPAMTRPLLADWVRDAYEVLEPGPRPLTRP
ncbi:acyl-CoA carboxylase subunit beta [Nonomuraea soli]|uniref:Propionyl-CoA carboxylase beta chain n=1 Tax=Nonomuraea soli TaxID=1032476 RepID=A0A7W0HV46_9ACTN|nr:carboxyl transferase domain-containing protein [Nonomuraea soli]MBA2896874.1 propionyl-CoA carboxylase beta chain [Nonomuraea soli]